MAEAPDPRAEALEAFRDAFTRTPLHRLLGLRFSEPPGLDAPTVTIEMPVDKPAFNGSGNLHGGAIATLVDVAAGSCAGRASNFDPRVHSLVTADLHVRYLGRPKGSPVRAQAQLMRSGRMLIVVEVRVLDPFDNLIAVADFSAMVVARREPLEGVIPTDPQAPDL
ncbi:MAG TPA: PaaI family thioesterase [Acidimicrobiia bacterium]|nr:PaaI family thioesterase [Acidimicrobiia bacterium]